MLFQKGALPTPIPYDSEPIKKPHHPPKPKPKSVAAKKHRNFLFSLMNYQSKPLTVDMLDSVDCKYIEYAMETPTTMYRLHDSLQGLITSKNPHGLNAVRSLLPGCGVIVCPDLQKHITNFPNGLAVETLVTRGTAPIPRHARTNKERKATGAAIQ
jgi:hypothetical protein